MTYFRRSLKLHLSQMKTNCSKLDQDIETRKEQNKSKMMRKFGMIVDFDEMEESILRKAVLQHTNTGGLDDSEAKLIIYLEVNIAK